MKRKKIEVHRLLTEHPEKDRRLYSVFEKDRKLTVCRKINRRYEKDENGNTKEHRPDTEKGINVEQLRLQRHTTAPAKIPRSNICTCPIPNALKKRTHLCFCRMTALEPFNIRFSQTPSKQSIKDQEFVCQDVGVIKEWRFLNR